MLTKADVMGFTEKGRAGLSNDELVLARWKREKGQSLQKDNVCRVLVY